MQPVTLRQTLLNRCGAVILFAGICLGAFVYWSAPQGTDAANAQAAYDDSSLAPDDSRRYARDTEVNSGKVGLLMDRWTRSLASQRRSKSLAIAIIMVSALAAGGCFLAAGRGDT
jgi:hypothetical protein